MKIETLEKKLIEIKGRIKERIDLLKKYKQKGAPVKGNYHPELLLDTRDAFLSCSTLIFSSCLDEFYGLLEKICVLEKKKGGVVPEKDDKEKPLKVIEKIVGIGLMTPKEGAEWIELKNLRNSLIHEYNEDTALLVYDKVGRLHDKFKETSKRIKEKYGL